MERDSVGRSQRFEVIGEVKFSRSRDLVVSVLNGRIVLGQRVYFQDDADTQQRAFMRNAPSLSAADARQLEKLLDAAASRVEQQS